MAAELSFDTSFLIDIQKEKRDGQEGRAHLFLKENSEAVMLLSVVALGEFAEGFADPNDPNLHRMLGALQLLDIDRQTGLLYGQLTRRLRKSGQLIGSNDLWIGSAALRHQVPLVTGNPDHFRRLPGLKVVDY